VQVQVPEVHLVPPGHALSQAPQWRSFDATATHEEADAQNLCPETGQVQLLPQQTCVGPHAFPHAPQFAASEVRLMHAPAAAHHVVPYGHAQTPPEQTSVDLQVTPQPPQLVVLVDVLTQAERHGVRPDALHRQAPPLQYCDDEHAFPHAPQFSGSFIGMQVPPHFTPLLQRQAPEEQTSPGAQVLPQAPQFIGSPLICLQAPLHSTPILQLQVPPKHVWSLRQLAPQAPQFRTSVAVLTHASPQAVAPPRQPHVPLMQASAGLHALPQEPQLFRSVETLVHTPEHASGVEASVHSHFPLRHEKPVPQTVPHVPQLSLAVFRSTQPEAQESGATLEGHAQLPSRQTWSFPHDFPQAPQWAVLDFVSTHAPPQSVSPLMHPHTPSLQR